MIEVEIDQAAQVVTLVVEPDHGRRVVFVVETRSLDVSRSRWTSRWADRFVVGLRGSTGSGFAHFTDFERAVRSALWRARRYEKAYSVPRGVPTSLRGAA